MRYYLGIDIGTSGSKAVLLDENLNIAASAQTSHGVHQEAPGWFGHDADLIWWGDFCHLSREILAKSGIQAKEIACLGLSALGCDCVPVDEEGKALAEAILYGIDSRCGNELAWIKDYYGTQAEATFGHTPCSSDVAPKILWYKNNHPEIWEKAHKFLTASSYINARLTGYFVLDSYLAEDFRPMYDPKSFCEPKAKADPEGCKPFCRPDQMAELLAADAISGTITEAAAKDCGLAIGTPVLTGTGDSGAEAISAGVTAPGDLMIQLGSTAYMILLSDRMIDEPRLWPGTFILPDTYGICAGTNTAGKLMEWMRKEWYDLPKGPTSGLNDYEGLSTDQNSPEKSEDDAYLRMVSEASQIPAGSDGLICLPYFAGERTPINDPYARGCFYGLSLMHSRGHMVKAALEGICYSIKDNLTVMQSHGLPIKRILVTGGGTHNPVWLQCLASILENELLIPEITIGAAYGDALMAAKAFAPEKSWSDLAAMLPVERVIKPNAADFEVYRKGFEAYRGLYQHTKQN